MTICRSNGRSRPLLHTGLWGETTASPPPPPSHRPPPAPASITSPEGLFPSRARSPRGELGFSSAGTHPKEAPAAGVLWLTRASHALRRAWGLSPAAKGCSRQLRARGGAASSVSWRAAGLGVCVGSTAGWESHDSHHTPDSPVPPTSAGATLRYGAVSSHATASETDDELPLISLKALCLAKPEPQKPQ